MSRQNPKPPFYVEYGISIGPGFYDRIKDADGIVICAVDLENSSRKELLELNLNFLKKKYPERLEWEYNNCETRFDPRITRSDGVSLSAHFMYTDNTTQSQRDQIRQAICNFLNTDPVGQLRSGE